MPQFPLRPAKPPHFPPPTHPTRAETIRTKNRRKRYLDLTPSYFTSPHLELSQPLLYDTLIRHFLSPSERQAQATSRGYADTLEASLVRSEAKLYALREEAPVAVVRGGDGEVRHVVEEGEGVRSKGEGWERWVEVMGRRFVRGEDGEFDYGGVDGSEEFDDWGEEDRERLERWLGEGTEEFIGVGSPKGETGVQDF